MDTINKSTKKLLSHIAYMLPNEQLAALWEKVNDVLIKHDLREALFATLSEGDSKSCWLLMQVDSRDHQEVEWQAQALAKTHNITDNYHYHGSPEDADDKVLAALAHFSQWLKQYGFSYVVWDTDSDECLGFVFPKDKVASFLSITKKLGMNCYAFKHKKKAASTEEIKLKAYTKLMASYAANKADHDIGGFSIENIESNNDSKLHDLIAAAAARANAIGYKPYLYIGARWCEPCLEFCLALESKVFISALQGVCLVMMDLDIWSGSLAEINMADISNIPTLVMLDDNGCVTNKVADFSLVEENTPNLLAEFLIPFFND